MMFHSCESRGLCVVRSRRSSGDLLLRRDRRMGVLDLNVG
ncbi:hypothetical protein FHR81_003268 [Actinoalloteichus hoggarensis]|nr:hypothetical protein [Actinoalloteichus hoggarensis]